MKYQYALKGITITIDDKKDNVEAKACMKEKGERETPTKMGLIRWETAPSWRPAGSARIASRLGSGGYGSSSAE
jgi:hypothetical protein